MISQTFRRAVGPSLVVLVFALAGCSGDDTTETTDDTGSTADEVTTTTATSTSSSTSTAPPSTTEEATTTTEAPVDVDAICEAYLQFAAARTPEERIPPTDAIWLGAGGEQSPELENALRTLSQADFGTEDVRAEQAVLTDFVLPKCEEQYNSGIVPAADDATAAAEFYAALVAGDRDKARTLAGALTIAKFEPWAPPEDPGEIFEVDGGFGMTSMDFGQASCQVSGGVITRCGFG